MMDNYKKEEQNYNENNTELIEEFSIDDEIESYIDAIYIKNHLLGLDFKQLKDIYIDYDSFEFFVYNIIYILDCEPEFFLLDDSIPSKIYDVLDLHRFDCKDNPILCGLINEIIMEINSMRSLPTNIRDEKLSIYLNEQSEKRKVLLTDKEDLSYTMVYDAGVILYLIGEGENIKDENMYVPSLNLLMNEIPNIFKNKDIAERAINKLNEISKKHIIFGRLQRRYANDAKVYLKKIGE